MSFYANEWEDPKAVRSIPARELLPESMHAQADALAALRSEHASMAAQHREAFNPTNAKAAEEADRQAILSATDHDNLNPHANANRYAVAEAQSAEALRVKTAELNAANAEWRQAMADSVVARYELADEKIDPAADEYAAAINALIAAKAKFQRARGVVNSLHLEADWEAWRRRESTLPYRHGRHQANGRADQYFGRVFNARKRGLANIPATPTFDQVVEGLRSDADPGTPVNGEAATVEEFMRYVEKNRDHNGGDMSSYYAGQFDKFVWLPAMRSELPRPVIEPEPEPAQVDDEPEFDDHPTPATERGTSRRGRRNVAVIPPSDFR